MLGKKKKEDFLPAYKLFVEADHYPINLNNISPIEALNKLNEIKKKYDI